jgi:tousled-like kinase
MTENDAGGSIDLTSQGAGTYWYLPPECFGTNPRISSKVDVWSCGVILYQMLYGVRPFGDSMSQEVLLEKGVIARAGAVTFPDKPSVGKSTQAFIRKCLSKRPEDRPEILTVFDVEKETYFLSSWSPSS